jgi:hypothetical protein
MLEIRIHKKQVAEVNNGQGLTQLELMAVMAANYILRIKW